MVLNRGSSRRELARVGICGNIIVDKYGNNKANNDKDGDKNDNKDKKFGT